MSDDPATTLIRDAARQVASMRAMGGEPIRVRVSVGEWRLLRHSLAWSHLYLLPDSEITLCGLPVRVDRDWHAPIAVESREDQKPFAP